MSSNENFARNLVKGKIAETIFAQMLRETGKFTVLEFGYEKLIPELVMAGNVVDETIEIIRRAPDFAVINKETKEVKLIEVKYKRRLNKEFVLKDAKRMMEAWNPSFLFIVTHYGFYFDDIRVIVENGGEIRKLNHPFISDEVQDRYLQILKDFEEK